MGFFKIRTYNGNKKLEDVDADTLEYWEVDDGGENIKVKPIGRDEIRLYINEKLQDVSSDELKSTKLYGKLSNGKDVKVAITVVGSRVNCYIFVDNKCIFGE